MKTLAELRAELKQQREEADTIVSQARADKRDLTEDEDARLALLIGVGAEGTEDYQPGLIRQTMAAVDKAERYEARMTESDRLLRDNRPIQLQAAAQPLDNPRTFRIPATARRPGNFKSFRGENAERDAYLSGMWVLATTGNENARQWCLTHGVPISMAQGENTDSKGGYLVPEQFESAIINLRESRGVFRRFSRREPMTSDTKTVPRRTGGLTLYYPAENTALTESEKSWDQIKLTARKGAVLAKYSSELNEDAVISIADDLAEEIGYAFADGEDQAGFNGDGSATYGGMVGLKHSLMAGSVVTAITGNTSFGTLDLEDFEAMVGKLPDYATSADVGWYISRAGWAASMLRLQMAAGGNTAQIIAGDVAPQFMGYPVRFAQVMNSTLTAQVSTSGLVYFGSLRQGVAFGDRRGLTLMTSTERYFELDQLAIKGTQRFDIVVHEKGTSSVPGSIIMLATPGS